MFGNIRDKINEGKEMLEAKKMLDKFNAEADKIVTEVYEGKYKIVIRGNTTIDGVYENGELNEALKKLINKGLKESQKNVGHKLRNRIAEMGFGFQ